MSLHQQPPPLPPLRCICTDQSNSAHHKQPRKPLQQPTQRKPRQQPRRQQRRQHRPQAERKIQQRQRRPAMRRKPPSRQNIHRRNDLPQPKPTHKQPHTSHAHPRSHREPAKTHDPATNPTSRLRRSLRETVTPPRNAPQNFAIIKRPLCESSIPHCRASSGKNRPQQRRPQPCQHQPEVHQPQRRRRRSSSLDQSTPAANLCPSHYHGHRSLLVPRKPLFFLAFLTLLLRLPPELPPHSSTPRATRRPSPSAAKSSPPSGATSRSTAKPSLASWKP